jgi:hypothetical protein
MWTIIRQYYLFLFLTFLVLFTLQVLMTDSPNTVLENALIVVGGALIISLFCGTIYYLMDTKWGPKKRQKMMAKSPFKEFLAAGFEQKEDHLAGRVRDYTVLISFTWWTGRSAITPNVLFHPKPAGRFHSMEELKAIRNRHKKSRGSASVEYLWTRCSLGLPMEYLFRPPTYEKVMGTVHQMIDILMTEGLHPISYEENDRLLPELVQEIETNNELMSFN